MKVEWVEKTHEWFGVDPPLGFRELSIPRFNADRITVILSVINLLYTASFTNSLATFYGSCSMSGIAANFSFTMSTHSWDENLSNNPSEANKIKSSVTGSRLTTLI